MILMSGILSFVVGMSDTGGTDSPLAPNLKCVRVLQSIQNPSIWRYRVFVLNDNDRLYDAHPTEDHSGIQVQTGDSYFTRQTASVNFAASLADTPQVEYLDQEASLALGWPPIYSESKKWSAIFDPRDFQLRVYQSEKPTGTAFRTVDLRDFLERSMASPLKPRRYAPRFRFNFDPSRPNEPEELLNISTPSGFQDLELASGEVLRIASFENAWKSYPPKAFPWDGDATIAYDFQSHRVFSPIGESYEGAVQITFARPKEEKEFVFFDSALFPDGRQRLLGIYTEIQPPNKRQFRPKQFIGIWAEDVSVLSRFKFRRSHIYQSPHDKNIRWARSDGRSLLTYSPTDKTLIWHNLNAPENQIPVLDGD